LCYESQFVGVEARSVVTEPIAVLRAVIDGTDEHLIIPDIAELLIRDEAESGDV